MHLHPPPTPLHRQWESVGTVASCRPTPLELKRGPGDQGWLIRNSPKTYRRIDSIEGHRLPLDAHMTGGEGRRPGARGGVAVVVLLAFLVLAVRYRIFYFDIFAIFGGTVYPSWDCLRRAKQARSPRPRPRAPVCPRDRSREGVVITTSRPRRRRASRDRDVRFQSGKQRRELEVGRAHTRVAPR